MEKEKIDEQQIILKLKMMTYCVPRTKQVIGFL